MRSVNFFAEKGEEVYSLIYKWWLNQMDWFSKSRLVMEDKIDYNEFLDLYLKSSEEVDLRVEIIDFIMSVHFSKLFDSWKECLLAVQGASTVEGRFKEDYKSGRHTGGIHLPDLRNAMLEANGKVEFLLSKLANDVRQEVSF